MERVLNSFAISGLYGTVNILFLKQNEEEDNKQSYLRSPACYRSSNNPTNKQTVPSTHLKEIPPRTTDAYLPSPPLLPLFITHGKTTTVAARRRLTYGSCWDCGCARPWCCRCRRRWRCHFRFQNPRQAFVRIGTQRQRRVTAGRRLTSLLTRSWEHPIVVYLGHTGQEGAEEAGVWSTGGWERRW